MFFLCDKEILSGFMVSTEGYERLIRQHRKVRPCRTKPKFKKKLASFDSGLHTCTTDKVRKTTYIKTIQTGSVIDVCGRNCGVNEISSSKIAFVLGDS